MIQVHLNKKQKKTVIRILLSTALLIAAAISPLTGYYRAASFLIPYLLISYDTLLKAARNCLHGQLFDENLLMGIASIGAFVLGEYPEAVLVMLLNHIGDLFEKLAVGSAKRSIAELMDIRPDTATVIRNNEEKIVSPDEVETGEILLIRPGERIPIDGVVIEGESALDKKSLTGESVPTTVHCGDEVLSGCINLTAILRVRTTVPYQSSAVNRILTLIEEAQEKKAPAETFINRFARYYTPLVVLTAFLLAVIPPLFDGYRFAEWIQRALIFLVVSCPCALVISVPLSYFGGIGAGSRIGVLVKGGNVLDRLAEAEIMVFDKTGTLTEGVFRVASVISTNNDKELIENAAYAEAYSTHPIATAILEAYGSVPDKTKISDYVSVPGKGVKCITEGHTILAGNRRFLSDNNIKITPAEAGTTVHVSKDGIYLGRIEISDKLKEGSVQAIRDLTKQGILRLAMFTGDADTVAEKIAEKANIKEYYHDMLPQDKVSQLESIKQQTGKVTAFVGDGVNDAPVLVLADVGIAMGAIGSDAAVEAADIVLTDDDPRKIVFARRIAEKTSRIVRENIVFALSVKAAVLILGALGIAGMWLAMFADVGVSVIAILNAMRTLSVKGTMN